MQFIPTAIYIDDVLRELKNKIHPGIKLSNNTTVNMLLLADDMLIIQENEDVLQKSTHEVQQLSNNYNFNISTTKIKVMAFQGKYPIRSKIILNNKSITEKVSNFNYLGCNVTHKYDEDLNDKLSKFQNICRVIARTLTNKTRKEPNLKCYKIMAVPVLLYGSERWTPRKRDWNRIQVAEMKHLRTVKRCTGGQRLVVALVGHTDANMYAPINTRTSPVK
jgi:hypothetical protein